MDCMIAAIYCQSRYVICVTRSTARNRLKVNRSRIPQSSGQSRGEIRKMPVVAAGPGRDGVNMAYLRRFDGKSERNGPSL